MKTKLTILITVVLLNCIVGYMACKTMRVQLEAQQNNTQRAIEQNPELAQFYQ